MQCANIHWAYKCTEDIIKVEVWDVVDVGKSTRSKGLKIANDESGEVVEPVLDARFVDVYKVGTPTRGRAGRRRAAG